MQQKFVVIKYRALSTSSRDITDYSGVHLSVLHTIQDYQGAAIFDQTYSSLTF